MSQSQLIRLLISGYQPPQAPDEAFYEEMDRLLKTSGELIALSRELENDEMREAIKEEGLALRKLRMGIEKKYLSGERRSPVWQ